MFWVLLILTWWKKWKKNCIRASDEMSFAFLSTSGNEIKYLTSSSFLESQAKCKAVKWKLGIQKTL